MANDIRVLYVEDEPDIQALAELALVNLGGMTVKSCHNGREAVEVINDFAPDLIILDAMMPVMDGPTTLQEIRKLDMFRETPVIFMTARTKSHEIQQFLDLGAVDIIAKPFDPMSLANRVREIYQRAG